MRISKLLLGAFALMALTLTPVVASAQKSNPTMRLCTGGQSGNYFAAGKEIKGQSADFVNVEVIETKGSMDNLERLVIKKECDGAIVQNDSLGVFKSQNASARYDLERVAELYTEYVHLLCNKKADLDKITKLGSNHTVAVGGQGSGTATTWASFVAADPKRYGSIKTSPMSGVRAANKVADGLEIQCMIWTSGLNSGFMKEDLKPLYDRLKLVDADDRDMDNAKDERGRPIYKFVDIPRKVYPGLNSADTVGVSAVMIVTNEWIEANERAYNKVITAVNAARPTFASKFNPIPQ